MKQAEITVRVDLHRGGARPRCGPATCRTTTSASTPTTAAPGARRLAARGELDNIRLSQDKRLQVAAMARASLLQAPARARCAAPRRPAARRRLPAAVDVDPDQLLRRPGHDARAAADGGGAAARHADPDGPADGDGDRCPSCCCRCSPVSGWTACASCRSTWPANCMALAVASVPLAWWLGWLTHALAVRRRLRDRLRLHRGGSAAQIVLTQVVARERLVEAHAKNALASSGAEVAGPGLRRRADQAGGRAAGAAGRRG
jgi:hypothetical protein